MKDFKFKLQSVLDARQKKLENCQLEFAKAQNKLQRENLILSNFVKTLNETTNSLEEILKKGDIDNTIVLIHQNYIKNTNENIENQKITIKRAEKELEEKNRLMLEALKAKKIIEKLKDKALNEFKESINKHEMLLIDEIATNRYKKA